MYDKEPNISNVKLYKKLTKNTHALIPNYLEDMEKKRKEKEVVPDDFLSDNEVKEGDMERFKPPKPIKPGKRVLNPKSHESHGKYFTLTTSVLFSCLLLCFIESAEKPDMGGGIKDYPEDMIVNLSLKEEKEKAHK